MRKLLSVITAAAACVLLCSAASYAVTVKAAAATIVDGEEKDPADLLWYRELDDGEAEIYLLGTGAGLTSIDIPEEIDGLKVTGLADMAFYGCDELLSVTLPDTLRYIGSRAFENCTALDTVTLPESLTVIGSEAFSGCAALKTILLPDRLETIDRYAFSDCTGLTSITIPDSVTLLEEKAFYGCTSLASVTMPDVIENIGSGTFEDTPFWDGQPGVKYGGKTVIGCDDTIEDAVIIDGTLVIGSGAFSGSAVRSVTVPESVEYISDSAFKGCGDLTTVNMPDKIIKIGDSAFKDTPYYDNQEGDVKYAGKMAVECEWSAGSVRIKPGTLAICDNVFDGTRLESIFIPDGVIEIGDYAFQDTWVLKSVTIPESVKKIGIGIFKNSEVKSVTILGGIDNIPDEAFYKCESLESLYIPSGVKTIGTGAFDGCRASNIYFAGTEEEWNNITVNDENSGLSGAVIHYSSAVPEPELTQIPISPDNASMTDMELTVTDSYGETAVLPVNENGMADLSEIVNGDYIFTFSAANCAARSYDVTLYNGEITGLDDGVELHLYGDINGDGKIDISEAAKVNAYAKGNENILSDYALSICDVNGDGVIDAEDVKMMNMHLIQTVMLW